MKNKQILILFTLLFSNLFANTADKKFVIIIPSYNNEQWVRWNLNSVFSQEYDNYRVIYIDDASKDSTADKVMKHVAFHKQTDRFRLICNKHRCLQLTNRYKAILSCDNDEIMVMLDGDDAFAHPHVLQKLNEAYQDKNVWMTYSQYKKCCRSCMHSSTAFDPRRCRHVHGNLWTRPYTQTVIINNSYRTKFKGPFHLRTFYAWLYKQIHLKDLFYQETLFPMGTDSAVFFPLIEMAGMHAKYIPEALYLYNQSNPLCVQDRSGERRNVRINIIRDLEAREKYQPLKRKSVTDTAHTYVILSLNGPHTVAQIRQLLSSTTYVFFSSGDNTVGENELNAMIIDLEDTHVFGWYLDRMLHSQDAPSCSPVLENTYAWKYHFSTGKWRKPFATTNGLFRTRDVLHALQNCKDDMEMKDVVAFLSEYELEKDEVGLFGALLLKGGYHTQGASYLGYPALHRFAPARSIKNEKKIL